MDFEFSDEQELLRTTVRRFLAERAPITPWVRRMLDDARGCDDEVWQGLADLGATGLLVGEAHGGSGMGMLDMGVVLEELGRAVFPGPLESTSVAGASLIDLAGSADDHTRWLPGLAAGRLTVAVALDAAHLTVAGPVDPGAEVAVTGSLHRLADAWAADLLLLAQGDRVLAVDTDATGLQRTACDSVDGTRKQADVTLDDVDARVLGGARADQAAAITATRDRLLVSSSVDGLGAAGLSLELAVAYARERVQFGRPIGSFQAVQHLCADMLQDVEMGRVGCYYALWACDRAPALERHRAAVMARAWAGSAFARVAATAIQVFGGIGFTWEHDAHLPYKRLLSLQQRLGGTADHLGELASLAVDGAT